MTKTTDTNTGANVALVSIKVQPSGYSRTTPLSVSAQARIARGLAKFFKAQVGVGHAKG